MAKENSFDETGDTQHPDIDSGADAINVMRVNPYQLVEEAFEGTGGFKTGTYLVAHHREIFYGKRRQYSHYTNYIRPIVTAMYKACFNEPIVRDTKNDMFDNFELDCTSSGGSLTEFVKLVVKYVRMHSMVLVVVDNKNTDGIELRTELIKNKKHPYCYIKKAYEINSDGTKFDEFGKLLTVMYFDHTEEDENKESVNIYRQWSDKETVLYRENKSAEDCDAFESKYNIIETQPNLLGRLPCFLMYEEILDNPKKLFAEPSRYQLVKVNHTIFNQDSEGRTVERDQGFGILTVPDDPSGEDQDKTIGTNNFLTFPPDSRHPPAMISVDPSLVTALSEKRNSTMESLIAVAEQSGVQGVTKSKDAKSGLAYAFEFFAYESTLRDSSRLAEDTEKKIVSLFNDWTNENIKYEITYPRDFKPNKDAERHKEIKETIEIPGCPKPYQDKMWEEKYMLDYPEDEKGLKELQIWLEENKEPEFENDQDVENNAESES